MAASGSKGGVGGASAQQETVNLAFTGQQLRFLNEIMRNKLASTRVFNPLRAPYYMYSTTPASSHADKPVQAMALVPDVTGHALDMRAVSLVASAQVSGKHSSVACIGHGSIACVADRSTVAVYHAASGNINHRVSITVPSAVCVAASPLTPMEMFVAEATRVLHFTGVQPGQQPDAVCNISETDECTTAAALTGRVAVVGTASGLCVGVDTRAPSAPVLQLAQHTMPVTSVCAAAQDHRVITASADGMLALWDVRQTAQPRALVKVDTSSISAAAVSPDTGLCAVSTLTGVYLVDPVTNQVDGLSLFPDIMRGAATVVWSDSSADALYLGKLTGNICAYLRKPEQVLLASS